MVMVMDTAEVVRPIRVVVADDHPMLARAIHLLLDAHSDIEVLAEVGDGQALLDAVEDLLPDVALVDLEMPRVDGPEAIRRIRETHPQVHCLVLTVHEEESYLHQAALAGASGYLLKGASPDELAEGIRAVAHGKAALHPLVTQYLVRQVAGVSEVSDWEHEPLSHRELEVLTALAGGMTNREIATHLGIGPETVKTHLAHIYTKMGVSDRAHVVAAARRRGLLPPPS